VSNDVQKATPGTAVWAALLTPQGKWLADFFIFADGARLLLDCEAGQAPMLVQRLTRHRLRARVAIAATDLHVQAGWNGPMPTEGIVSPDPRLAAAGWRRLGTTLPADTADTADYDRHRLSLGLPDGSRDLEAEKTVLLEAGFDELNGISWTKGCYMGQELTARTRYRGLIKRRLMPVRIEGDASPDSEITQDGQPVGTLKSARGGSGLANLRLTVLQNPSALLAGTASLTIARPDWMRLPSG
jgi:folate-binding protein YgfZ